MKQVVQLGISCSDVCDWVMGELLRLGFPLDVDDESHDDVWEAIHKCKIMRCEDGEL